MRDLLETLLGGTDLRQEQAEELLSALISTEVAPERKAAALAALRTKGETAEELRGLAMAMRAEALPVRPGPGAPLVDTCGTGGDGSHSFNVSTATSLVLAGLGLRVVKHGNRSVSSKCGSADVLEALGIPLATTAEQAEAQLADTGFTFLFAPVFHAATKAVVPVRRALGVRTAFNLLGPLSNPAAPQFQLIGAFDEEATRLMAHALSGMPITKAYVVHGEPGWDEATPCGRFLLCEVTAGKVEERRLDPLTDYGIERCAPEDLGGGDAEMNSGLMRQLLQGERGPIRDAVCLNAALVLQLTGRIADGREAVAAAGQALDSGRVQQVVDALVSVRS